MKNESANYRLFGYFDDNSNLTFLKGFFDKKGINYKLTKINSIIDPLIVGQFLEPKYQLEIPSEHYVESIELFNTEMEKSFSAEDINQHIMNTMSEGDLFNTLTNGTDPEAAFIANKILRNRGVDINEHMRQLKILNNFDGKTTSDLDEKNRKSFNFWFIIILIVIATYFLIHFL